jgi:hypothetical protein
LFKAVPGTKCPDFNPESIGRNQLMSFLYSVTLSMTCEQLSYEITPRIKNLGSFFNGDKKNFKAIGVPYSFDI